MRSRKPVIIVTLLAMFTMVFNSVGLIADAFFYNMEDLPVGEKALTTVSPDGSFELSFYVVDTVLGSAVRGETLQKDGTRRNVYWQTSAITAAVSWVDDENVSVNGNTFNAKSGSFDSRQAIEQVGPLFKINK